jgi:hypothetical protein
MAVAAFLLAAAEEAAISYDKLVADLQLLGTTGELDQAKSESLLRDVIDKKTVLKLVNGNASAVPLESSGEGQTISLYTLNEKYKSLLAKASPTELAEIVNQYRESVKMAVENKFLFAESADRKQISEFAVYKLFGKTLEGVVQDPMKKAELIGERIRIESALNQPGPNRIQADIEEIMKLGLPKNVELQKSIAEMMVSITSKSSNPVVNDILGKFVETKLDMIRSETKLMTVSELGTSIQRLYISSEEATTKTKLADYVKKISAALEQVPAGELKGADMTLESLRKFSENPTAGVKAVELLVREAKLNLARRAVKK